MTINGIIEAIKKFVKGLTMTRIERIEALREICEKLDSLYEEMEKENNDSGRSD